MTYDYIITKPNLDEDLLMHYGVKGMKWRKRKGTTSKPLSRKKKITGDGKGIKVKKDQPYRVRDIDYVIQKYYEKRHGANGMPTSLLGKHLKGKKKKVGINR